MAIARSAERLADAGLSFGPIEAAVAVLFHLDKGFRNGVSSMIRHTIPRPGEPWTYMPAVFVGNRGVG